MKHTKTLRLLLSVATLAAAAGCVREELSECLTTIAFSYTGDTRTEIFADKIDHIDLYVFDKDHRVVLSYEPNAAELAAQRIQVVLPTGRTYHAVAVANAHHNVTHGLEDGTPQDTRLMHPVTHPDHDAGDKVDTHDHLYQGEATLEIPPLAGSTHTIPLKASHIDMYVEVVGLGDAAPGATRQGDAEFDLEHNGLPEWVDFTNDHTQAPLIAHYPLSELEEGIHVHRYQVMRSVEGTTIHIHNPGQDREIFELDVDAYIAEVLQPNPEIPGPYDEDGVLIQEAFIPIRIEFKSVGVEVTIPSWLLTDAEPEF